MRSSKLAVALLALAAVAITVPGLVNLHNPDYSDGAIRGQLGPAL